MTEFVHLHTHSHYTLLESPMTIGDLVTDVAHKGMNGFALTDRGNLFGALECQVAASKADLQHIVGVQVNVTPFGMKEKASDKREMHQLVLLAKTTKGYFNLAKIVSLGWIDGFYFEPRIDLALLREHCEGLICLTGSREYGFLNYHLESGAVEEATRQAEILRDIFGDDLYIELTRHEYDSSTNACEKCIEISKNTGIPVVATNYVHYREQGDSDAHRVQMAVQLGSRKKTMPSDQFYLKTPDEMAALFSDIPEAISNTVKIAEACKECKIPVGEYHLPVFDCPDTIDTKAYMESLGEEEYRNRYIIDHEDKERNLPDAERLARIDADTHLTELCEIGVVDRYGDITDVIRERLDFELQTIARMGFGAYFLIVADFIGWAKDHDIPVGPGRGSAAGSIVAYSLGITDICPLKYGLLFERFLNPGRVSMPDIDIDFCRDGREQVIDYVKVKYGVEAVVQIMTLGTMKAKMAIKDVARVYEWLPEESQELANLVPGDPTENRNIPQMIGNDEVKGGGLDPVEKLQNRYYSDDRAKEVLDTATKLEKRGRALGVHACGVIIAPGPVSDYIPICTVKDKPASQYNMTQCEDCGLLKMDFLGLKTMSVLKKAADLVFQTKGIKIDYNNLPIDDKKTFALLGTGETLGVFQCESPGFQKLIGRLKPDRFEDLIALVALYRPGPLGNNMHIDYCDRKHGIQQVEYPHPVLKNILEETFGLFIYQEQIMNISRELSGFTPSDADNLRKAMGKKNVEILNKMESKFIDGAWERHQFPKEKSKEMWEQFIEFAKYCFNKSHSACYGLIAYWTAYMKANYFAEFMTANLAYTMGNTEKMTIFAQEIKSKGIDVLPPDVNESEWEFTYTGSVVRFGFGGIKGVGNKAAEHIIEMRRDKGRYESLYDFCEKLNTTTVNKRVAEHLVKVGGFDDLHDNRKSSFETIPKAYEESIRVAKDSACEQTTMFDLFEQEDSGFNDEVKSYSKTEDWEKAEHLNFEKDLSGYWMSGHPMETHREKFKDFATHSGKDLSDFPTGEISIAAVILGVRDIATKAGGKLAVLTLDDGEMQFESVLFQGRKDRRGVFQRGAYEKFFNECEENKVALFTGKIDTRKRNAAPPPPTNVEVVTDEDGNIMSSGAEEEAPAAQVISIILNEMIPMDQIKERMTREIEIIIDADETTEEMIEKTDFLIKENQGDCQINALVQTPNDVLFTVAFGNTWKVYPSTEVLDELKQIWGENRVSTKQKSKKQAQAFPEYSW